MDIIYLGHSSFKIRTRKTSVLTDPYDPKKVGLKFGSNSAEVVTVSHDHFDHNAVDLVKDVRKVVNGPGEYEISDVSIIGLSSFHDNKKGERRGKNTIYVFEIEGLRLAHLGDLGHKLTDKKIEEMGEINILMIPVGGEYTIGPLEATEIVRSIEPQIVIPMHYQVKGLDVSSFSKLKKVDEFLKTTGLMVERLSKLSVKVSDIGEEQKIVVLEKK